MLLQDQIAAVIDTQLAFFTTQEPGIPREILPQLPSLENFATIITGLRRCGKSTLLLQVRNETQENALFLNFEDIHLTTFETSDFVRLLNEIKKRNVRLLFFDEIQIVSGWEVFVHQLLREQFKVFVSGSNASLLSTEMATHLTGRQISIELFPFSYKEFLRFKRLEANAESFELYMMKGGMPEYLKSEMDVLLTELTDDILIKDITVRHSLKDARSLRQLAIFLNSNIGHLVSANKLIDLFGIKSASSILEYFSHLQDAYLFHFVPQFSYSLKIQARNPKKVYAVDTGLSNVLAFKNGANLGYLLENAVFLHLRRTHKELYYFKDSGECDFVVVEHAQIKQLIQVCYQLDDTNLTRETGGLRQAMRFFNIKQGYIVTMNQKDQIIDEAGEMTIVPAYDFFSR